MCCHTLSLYLYSGGKVIVSEDILNPFVLITYLDDICLLADLLVILARSVLALVTCTLGLRGARSVGSVAAPAGGSVGGSVGSIAVPIGGSASRSVGSIAVPMAASVGRSVGDLVGSIAVLMR